MTLDLLVSCIYKTKQKHPDFRALVADIVFAEKSCHSFLTMFDLSMYIVSLYYLN